MAQGFKNKIKNKLSALSKENETYRYLYRQLLYFNRKRNYKKSSKQVAVNEKMVIFEAFQGRSYACSPKALYLAMLNDEKYKDYQFVWAVNNEDKHKYLKKNKNTKVVKRLSDPYHKAMAQAKYIVFNSGVPNYITLKKEQVYVQTWHGTPLKRLGCDIEATGNALFNLKEIRTKYTKNGKEFSYLLSPSAFTTEKLCSAFNVSPERREQIVIEEGYPRNDALFKYTNEEIASFKEKLKLPEGKKVILYAPTFRDNHYENSVGFKYNGEMDFDRLREAIGEDCVILFRAHCQIADKFNFKAQEGFVYDVSNYEDVNELYIISDLLITDYSSVFFDYANLKRPMIFFMYDLDEYQNDVRDFYLDLEELPGPIVMTQEEVTEQIKKLNKEFVYDEKYKKFNERFNYLDGSDCSRKVLERIIH